MHWQDFGEHCSCKMGKENLEMTLPINVSHSGNINHVQVYG